MYIGREVFEIVLHDCLTHHVRSIIAGPIGLIQNGAARKAINLVAACIKPDNLSALRIDPKLYGLQSVSLLHITKKMFIAVSGSNCVRNRRIVPIPGPWNEKPKHKRDYREYRKPAPRFF